MQFVAINWHVYILTHSAFALGLIGLLRFLPILIFSLLGGAVADAKSRKKVLFITQSILIILSLVLALTTMLNIVNVLIIYIFTLFYSTTLAFDTPARQALFPNLVEKNDLGSAMSLNSIMIQSAKILGPTISGLLIAQTNLGFIYGINAISFVAVLISLYFIKTSGMIENVVPISIKGILEGFRYIKTQTIIWSTMLLDFFSTFFASATALLPIFAKDILHTGPVELGLLYAAPSMGAVAAGIFIANRSYLKKQGLILLTAIYFYAIGTIIFGISTIFPISFIAMFIVGAGDSISTIIRNIIRQIETPDHIRGRTNAINMIFYMGGPGLGDFEAGLLAGIMGGPVSVIIGGVGTLLVATVMGVGIPTLRKYDHYKNTDHNNPIKLIS